MAVALAWFTACGGGATGGSDVVTASCEGLPCGAHGGCVVTDLGVTCVCEAPWTGARCDRCQSGYHFATADSCAADVSCEPFTCHGNGICDDALGVPTCACSLGYAGDSCDHCGDGYHPLDTGRCVVDAACATADPCGAHGTCDDTGGVITCGCAVGWRGDRCDACADGYHLTGGACVVDERCAGDSCGGFGHCAVVDGLARCSCDVGHGGLHCERCEPGYHADALGRCPVDRFCSEQNPCGPFASCQDAGGETSCSCSTGYAGWVCRSCAPGYHLQPTGFCAADAACLSGTCAGAGTCSVDAGGPVCACDPGTRGAHCELCAAGFHRPALDAACQADVPCTVGSCGGDGSCDDGGGQAQCTCDLGYAGAACAACAPGYHTAAGGACVLDTACAPTTCAGTGTCDDASGDPTCGCGPERAGVHCEICTLGYHADGSGVCVADDVCGAESCSQRGGCLVVAGLARCDCAYSFGGAHCGGCAPGFVPVDADATSCVFSP